MSGSSELGVKVRSLWQNMDEIAKDVLLYLVYNPQPVSLDTLTCLANASAVKVLNVIDMLKKKRMVYEKKECQRGLYFLNGLDLVSDIQKHITKQKKEKVLRDIVVFFTEALNESNEKTLILAELFQRLGDNHAGLDYIGNAANIFFHSGQKEKAQIYYDHFFRNFSENGLTSVNATVFLDSVLGKIALTKNLMPIHDQVLFLERGKKVAKRYEKWDHLAKINLSLGQALKVAGQYKKASRCFNDYRKFAEKINDKHMLKIAELSISDFLVWKGRVAEAIRRYEAVAGNLEEFSDDEATLKASAMLGWCNVICGRISRGLGMIDAVRSKAQFLHLQDVLIYSDLMSALSLLEIRKIPDTEFYLERIFSFPEETLGHYVLWASSALMAYVHFTKNEYEKAFECQKKAVEHSRTLGWMHHRGPFNFEYLSELEKRGFFYKEMNYDSEIQRILAWDDIYMKGVALRYRALRNMERQDSTGRILLDLKNSENYLKKAGTEIELARTRTALGNIYLKRGEQKLARYYLGKAWMFFSKVDKNLFPKDLLVVMPQEQKIEAIIDSIININESLGTISDMSSFFERVIYVAIDFTMAMRGAFFTIDDKRKPTIIASRNLDRLLLKEEQFRLIEEIVTYVARENKEAIMPGLNETDTISDESFLESGINSIICMPVKLGKDPYGYLYLDNRFGGRPFSDNDLPFVRLFCNQIAVSLSNIKIYDQMRELRDHFKEEAIFYKREMGITQQTEMIIGKSNGIKHTINQIQQVAPTDSSVLIMGETGVGKELVAKAIHSLSARSNDPFIAVNIAAIPQELVAAELFGHEKGAFTGANERCKGRFEIANGGTIFLDEIGDMPLNIQVNLLRVLQEGTFQRLGSAKPIKSNFRVIAATHKNLPIEIEKGTFRQDLFYRLNVFPIYIPPLRERKDDIPLIANYFIEKLSRKMGKRIRRVPNEELKKLLSYHWPGNIRELEHFIERCVILSNGNTISFSGLDHTLTHSISGNDQPMLSLADMEREYIEKILNATHWRVSGPKGAASILGLKPTTLFFRIKKLGIKNESDHGN